MGAWWCLAFVAVIMSVIKIIIASFLNEKKTHLSKYSILHLYITLIRGCKWLSIILKVMLSLSSFYKLCASSLCGEREKVRR